MRKLFFKLGASAMLAMMLSLNFSLPLYAQGLGELVSPLENIKTQLEERIFCLDNVPCKAESGDYTCDTEQNTCVDADGNIVAKGIKVIDYSAKTDWGKLPQEIVEKLENAGYNNLVEVDDFLKDFTPKEKQEKLIDDVEGLSTDEANEVIGEIGARKYAGEYQIHLAVQSVAKVMRNLIGGLAIIWIIISGVMMIFAGGDESKITEQKNSITYAVVGLVAILLIERMVAVLYGVPAEYRTALVINDARFSNEVLGIVGFIKAVIGTAAVFMILVSGMRMLFAQGEEEQMTKQKKSILWVGIGLILILINKVVVDNIFVFPTNQGDEIKSDNVNQIIILFGRVTQFFLGFVGIIAFSALIYGAGLMIANYGDEEQVTKAKKIIKNAIVGIIIIISAYTIVATMIGFK